MEKIKIAFKGTVLPVVYCSICGQELHRKPIALYYYMSTGYPYNHWEFKCPNKKWYNHHTSYKCDENGNTYAYEI
jgi:hypothetical protein